MQSYKEVLSHFKISDPLLFPYIQSINFSDWLSDTRENPDAEFIFRTLARNIISQQLSTSAANTIHNRFIELMPREDFTPEMVIELEDQKLRDVGISWPKVSYINDLATRIANNELQLDDIDSRTNEETIEELTKVKGIGVWTVEMFLMFKLGREDIFSYGDLGLKRGIEKVYQVEDPTKEQIAKIIEPWSPYKSYGSMALWHSLEPKVLMV